MKEFMEPSLRMTHRVFTFSHRVSYAECTVGNHVYYARFLDLLEKTRGEFFRDLGLPLTVLQDRDVIFPATECHLKYAGPARYDDRLAIEIWLNALRRVRLEFAFRVIHENGNLILEGSTEHACTTTADKLIRIPDDLAQRLRPYLNASRQEHELHGS